MERKRFELLYDYESEIRHRFEKKKRYSRCFDQERASKATS